MSKILSIKEYRKAEGLNYSFLKKVLENDTNETEASLAMQKGSLLDCLLTCESEFQNEFIVRDFKRPSGDLVSILEDNLVNEPLNTLLDKLVLEARKEGYGGKWKDETIKDKILKLEDYWNFLNETSDKILITTEEYVEAQRVITKLKTERPCKDLFNQKLIYQQPLFSEVDVDGNSVKVKCLPDILLIKPNYVHYYDLKRTDFPFSQVNRFISDGRSLLQMALTHDIIANKSGKKVLCSWIFVCKGHVYIKNVSEDEIVGGRDGYTTMKEITYVNEKEIAKSVYTPGYKDAIRRYQQAKELGLSHYNIERHWNQGITNKSIFE